MRKTIISAGRNDLPTPAGGWLDLDRAARVEVISEDPSHPIEAALLPDRGNGWRASQPGPQTIRLVFDSPQFLRRIRLRFVGGTTERTQEFVLRWVGEGLESREVVRQQWNFSPSGTNEELEEYQVDLERVTALELVVTPDVSGGESIASLAEWRIA